MKEEKKEHQNLIHYKVNDEEQTTLEKELTPIQIMQSAGIDPQTSFLEQIIGHTKKSYKENPTEILEMKNGMRFITIFIGPMPVS